MIDMLLNIDEHLVRWISDFGVWTYAILFLVILAETGFVATPFLPGDSLLFAVGAIAARGALDVRVALVLLSIAAIAGDSMNYAIGRRLGHLFLTGERKLLPPEHLERTHRFYERHGAKTIVLARFVPIVRTVAPFVAGLGRMNYRTFVTYNVLGGLLWVFGCVLAGYFFGGLPIVVEHFELVIIGIVAISVLPMAFEIVRARWPSTTPAAPTPDDLPSR